jgi:hypothetical protein
VSLAIGATLPLLILCLVGWWIGRFYQLKFGENPQSWLFLLGGFSGLAGTVLHRVDVLRPWTVALLLLGSLLVGLGSFRLWYLLMGARK